jgi:Ca2+-binding EF-hand superfamily protein
LESFKLFDKGGNGIVNAGDLLPVMKKYLEQK